MARIDLVAQKLKKLSDENVLLFGSEAKGITSNEIANRLELDRSNVSKDLNKLVSLGKAIKVKSRPVLFFDLKTLESNFSIKLNHFNFETIGDFYKILAKENIKKNPNFNNLIGYKGSLKDAIKKAEAAVLYPPKGLTTLITGETGVGKTLFVESMYEYATQKKILKPESPFIVFNCADYADNQQLLLSHLFGHKKGSFTGAVDEGIGLVEAADNGILFLDEVHRLSSKGQEMLFYLMDKGTYRKLGEVESSHKVNLRIIMATTEEPSKVMLDTFLRRIPVHIHLPALRQKQWEEKLSLIQLFIDQECKKINRIIRVNKDVMKILLNHEFSGNIGQMKSDLQFVCANAFVDSISDGGGEVLLKTSHLPTEMLNDLEGLENREVEIYSLPESLEFSPDKKFIRNQIQQFDFSDYQKIRDSFLLMEKPNSSLLTNEPLDNALNRYTSSVERMIKENDNTVQSMFLDEDIYKIVKNSLLGFVEIGSIELFSKILTHHIMIVLTNSDHNHQKISELHMKQTESLEIIEMIVEKINKEIKHLKNVNLAYIDLKLIEYLLFNLMKEKSEPSVGLLIVMHGNSTARSMAETVNQLLSIEDVKAIDMTLESKVSEIYERTKDKVKEMDKGLGVIILADMGSIKSFEKKLSSELLTEVKVIDMVSTPIVLEAARLALSRKLNLSELVSELNQILYRHWQSVSLPTSKTDFRYFESMMIEQLKRILVFLDSKKVFILFKRILEEITKEFDVDITDEFLLKFIFHNGCMIEKIMISNFTEDDQKSDTPKNSLYNVVKEKYIIVEEFFGIKVPRNELMSVVDMFMYEFPDKLLISNPNTKK